MIRFHTRTTASVRPGDDVNRFVRHIPNMLSGSRIALAALFPLMPPMGRIWICVLAALSDVLDGVAARRLDVDSPHGNIVDPVADKLFLAVVFITFVVEGALPLWELLVIGLRDIAVIGAFSGLLLAGRRDVVSRISSRILGKATTVLQFVVLAGLLLYAQTELLIVSITAVISFAAGIDYVTDFAKKAQHPREATSR